MTDINVHCAVFKENVVPETLRISVDRVSFHVNEAWAKAIRKDMVLRLVSLPKVEGWLIQVSRKDYLEEGTYRIAGWRVRPPVRK